MAKKLLILGLGNPILSDDAVGIRIVEEMRVALRDADINTKDVELTTGCFGGLHIIDAIRGYEKVVIIDAIYRGGEPGTLYRLSIDELNGTARLSSPHRINLPAAISLGRKIENEGDIPEDITIYAVEAKNLTEFSENLSPEIEEKLANIVKEIIREIFDIAM